MRYNEKELQALSRQPAELAAELGMRAPKKGSGERAGGREPGAGGRGPGRPAQEPGSPEHWPLFFPRSYEFMRRSLIFYRNEIQKMTGKDPLEQFGISEEARFQLSGLKA
ncbi:pleckstrin homology domain-containing family J member 1 [Pteropus vampyrus]|uniref:Pleckstrin homology domain-containing family J member 1 n=1 Tax=Pteropus vampyrus TaxID=132908 RepID=A0A6P6D284_PTEVA|nr:pleckstrin homology domain-containing family J member 1 [Pteropus vampyrus]